MCMLCRGGFDAGRTIRLRLACLLFFSFSPLCTHVCGIRGKTCDCTIPFVHPFLWVWSNAATNERGGCATLVSCFSPFHQCVAFLAQVVGVGEFVSALWNLNSQGCYKFQGRDDALQAPYISTRVVDLEGQSVPITIAWWLIHTNLDKLGTDKSHIDIPYIKNESFAGSRGLGLPGTGHTILSAFWISIPITISCVQHEYKVIGSSSLLPWHCLPGRFDVGRTVKLRRACLFFIFYMHVCFDVPLVTEIFPFGFNQPPSTTVLKELRCGWCEEAPFSWSHFLRLGFEPSSHR